MSALDDLDAISKERPLTQAESDALWSTVRHEQRDPVYRRWTLKDDAALLKAARKRGGLKEYAEIEGRTYASAQSRLIKLKRRRRQRGIAFIGRFFYDGEVGSD